MEHPISRQERADIRWALSDAFVDNEVNYAAIAKQVKDFDKKDIEDILFSEVAPVCHTNLESILPRYGAVLIERNWRVISKNAQTTATKFFRRQLDKLLIEWLRYRYKYIWIEIAKHYQNKNS